MRFSLDLHDKYVILGLEEDKLTSAIAPQLKSEFVVLHAEGRLNILFDMGEVRYADSSGLSALLSANRLFENHGGIFVIFNISPHVEKLITISQLDRVFSIVPTKQEAIEMAFMHEASKELEDEDDLSSEIMGEFNELDGPEDL